MSNTARKEAENVETRICRVTPPDEAQTTRIDSRELFGGARRVLIEHYGKEYSLLITRQGKLVLNRSS